jgi:hypothetical protein
MSFITSATASSSGFAPSPLTLSSVACGTAADTVIIGWISGNSSATNALTGMTVNGSTSGVSSQAQGTVSANDFVRLFWWTGTGPGTVPIGFTWTGDISLTSAGVLVYSGYSALANYTSALNLGGTSSPSLTVTCPTGDMGVAVWVNDATGTPTGTPSSPAVERIDTVAGFQQHLAWEEESVGSSVTINGTTSVLSYATWRFGFSLTAAAAAPTIGTQPTVGPTQSILLKGLAS